MRSHGVHTEAVESRNEAVSKRKVWRMKEIEWNASTCKEVKHAINRTKWTQVAGSILDREDAWSDMFKLEGVYPMLAILNNVLVDLESSICAFVTMRTPS